MQIINVEGIGKGLINTTHDLTGIFRLFQGSIKNIRALKVSPVRDVLLRQIYFTGIESLNKVAVIGTLIGIVIITQVANIIGLNAVLTGKILMWTVVRELGPLFSAIIVITRSSTAMASELGAMKINKEMEGLRNMGIDPFNYLIVPRVVGITVSLFILSFYFQITAIGGGLVVSSVIIDVPFFQHLGGIFSAMRFFEFGVSLLKSAVFGVIVGVVSCYHGLRVVASITEIPQVTTSAVIQSLFLVLISDGIITVMAFV